MTHDIIKTGDPDAKGGICDGNGDVVLALCRRCGKGEVELEDGNCVTGVIKNAVKLSMGRSGEKTIIIIGQLYHDIRKRWYDGKQIATSRVISIDGDLAKTENSLYRVEWLQSPG